MRFLLPSAAQRLAEPPAAGAWEPAMLALHAYRLAGHEAGATHVAAAIVATVVRDQIGRIARRSLPAYRPREWGAPPPTPEGEAEHRQVVTLVGVLLTQLWWTYKQPWPEVGVRPTRSRSNAGSRRPSARAEGRPTTCSWTTAWRLPHATRSWATPRAPAPPWPPPGPPKYSCPRAIASRAPSRAVRSTRRAPLVGTALARDFQGLLERLRNTLDPAEFGSPDWRREGLRGRLLSRLQRRGPRGLALALRTLLGPAFADLDRFWLAPSTPRGTNLASLAAWLDRLAPVAPSDRDFILFLDEMPAERVSAALRRRPRRRGGARAGPRSVARPWRGEEARRRGRDQSRADLKAVVLAAVEGIETLAGIAVALGDALPAESALTLSTAAQGAWERLEVAGVKRDGTVGEALDVARHKVVKRRPSGSVPPNTVLQVLSPGIVFAEERLRDAAVVVAKIGDR